MTETKKRRQGQRGTTPKPICPKCGEYMRRMYAHESINGKRLYIGAGWACPSINCNHIIKDFAELENIEDEN